MKVKDDLEVDINQAKTERGWKIKRVIWFFLALIILLVLLGITGEGPISSYQIKKNALVIDFEKFLRLKKEVKMLISLQTPGSTNEIIINDSFLEKIKINKINPEPIEVSHSDKGTIYRFLTEDEKSLPIAFYVEPVKPGSVILEVFDQSGNSIRKETFIYP